MQWIKRVEKHGCAFPGPAIVWTKVQKEGLRDPGDPTPGRFQMIVSVGCDCERVRLMFGKKPTWRMNHTWWLVDGESVGFEASYSRSHCNSWILKFVPASKQLNSLSRRSFHVTMETTRKPSIWRSHQWSTNTKAWTWDQDFSLESVIKSRKWHHFHPCCTKWEVPIQGSGCEFVPKIWALVKGFCFWVHAYPWGNQPHPTALMPQECCDSR